MLYLYQSNRLEDLADMLHTLYRAAPPAEPLAAEHVIVQSQGMRRYLNRFLAEADGIAANLTFKLPAGFNWQLMRDILPDLPELNPFSPGVMRWRLLKLFSDGRFAQSENFAASRTALGSYLSGSDTAAYQLAGQLADIFDQYLVYRPEWIDAWQKGRLLGLGDDEKWQAELWRELHAAAPGALHRVGMWQAVLDALANDKTVQTALPERLFVFGISTLAPMYLQLLKALAEHIDVHIFALNPGEHHWGNIISPAQILQHTDSDNLEAAGHPLLASLGKQGRDFFDALAQAECKFSCDAYSEAPDSDSLLHRLQFDIQTLQLPQAGGSPDNSIRLVSAHSPLRELHILKDHLLDLLEKNPEWQPHDIAVLTPDIAPYHPFIEAVFGQSTGSGRALPYSVSDTKIRHRQPLLDALAHTLEIFAGRFEVDTVLELLESDNVLTQFGLSRQDLPLLHEAVAELNIRWGWNGAMRGGSTLYTWQQGLQRIILGWMLPENQSLWQNTAAWHTRADHLPTLSRFSRLLDTLGRHYRLWQTPADSAAWADRVRSLKNDLLFAGEADSAAEQELETTLAGWQAEAALAGFDGLLTRDTALRHIGRFLDSESEAGFLRSGITFCGMVPMRSLPFKAICLLGLNDKAFPRNTKAAAYDLIARHPRAGDRARRDDDRYLFLEALLSAREHLYLSYIGRSIQNNDELTPSPLISELVDTLAVMTGRSSADWQQRHIAQHPLQAFSHRYFQDGPLFSSRSDYAEALNRPSEIPPFFVSEAESEAESDTPVLIRQNDLLAFWQNPPRYWLQNRLNWRAPFHDDAWDAAEPFEPAAPQTLETGYTDARRQHTDFAQTAAVMHARSQFPEAELGKLWQTAYETQASRLDGEYLNSPPLPDAPYRLEIGRFELEGSLDQLTQAGRVTTGSQSSPRTVAWLLQHLILNAVRPQGMAECYSHHLPFGQKPKSLPPLEQTQAKALLEPWLAYYLMGQTRPLPFFAKTCLEAAEAYLSNSAQSQLTPQERLMKKAYSAFYGNAGGRSVAQVEYTDVKTAFARSETDPLKDPLFLAILHSTLIPVLEHSGKAV